MKKTLLLALLLILGSAYCRAKVKYSGMYSGYMYRITISVSTEDNEAFLSVHLEDESRSIIEEPKMLVKLMNDSVITLDGKLLNSIIVSRAGVVVSNVMLPIGSYISDAKFPISHEQISQFGQGIKKLRLNTTPKYHEKEWKKDKIGKKIYEEYLECSPNSFEDKF